MTTTVALLYGGPLDGRAIEVAVGGRFVRIPFRADPGAVQMLEHLEQYKPNGPQFEVAVYAERTPNSPEWDFLELEHRGPRPMGVLPAPRG